MRAHCKTDIGLKRKENQDNFLINEDLGLYIVADGMGGHRGGELAAQMAIEVAEKVFTEYQSKGSGLSVSEKIQNSYTQASQSIFRQSQKDPQYMGMGTTMVLAYIHNHEIFIGNVGDSRAYFWNIYHIWQITEDHSLLNEHLKAGLIKDNEKGDFEAKNIITRSIGFENQVVCDVYRRAVSPGDRFLMCSDGLSGLISDEDIHRICVDNCEDGERLLESCIDEAKSRGGYDNITAIVISVED